MHKKPKRKRKNKKNNIKFNYNTKQFTSFFMYAFKLTLNYMEYAGKFGT